MDARPLARRAGLRLEGQDGAGMRLREAGAGEVHALDALSARVWRAADGELSVAEIAVAAETSPLAAANALDALAREGLLVSEPVVARRNDLDFARLLHEELLASVRGEELVARF